MIDIGWSMPGGRVIARSACALLLALSLEGCASWFGRSSATMPEEAKFAPAPKPQLAVGDSYLYDDNGNPVREQVMGFTGSHVIWFNDRGMSWTTNPDIVSPPLSWSADARLGPGSQHLFGDPGQIFPLQPGKSVKFQVAGSSENLPDGWQAENECAVKDVEDVKVRAGTFTSFRIDCSRGEVTESLYYAPVAQNYVLRLRRRGDAEPHERKELAEFQYAAIPERTGSEHATADAAMLGDGQSQHAMVPAGTQAAAMPPQPSSDFQQRLAKLEEAVAKLEKQTMAMAAATAATAPEPASRQPSRLSQQRAQAQHAAAPAAAHAPAAQPAEGKPAESKAEAGKGASMEAKPASGGGERFGVHLASYRSVAVAQQGWVKLTHSYPDLLGGADHRTTEFDPGDGRGVFIRLLAGPYPDRGEATKLCRELQTKQVFCRVVSLGPA